MSETGLTFILARALVLAHLYGAGKVAVWLAAILPVAARVVAAAAAAAVATAAAAMACAAVSSFVGLPLFCTPTEVFWEGAPAAACA